MKKLIIVILTLCIQLTYAQDRFTTIEKKLTELSTATPGLNETVDFSVVGVSIQEFLRGLAETNSLNISIDPTLDIRVYNNFTNEKVSNILIFLCKEYDLEIHFVGSIMSFKKHITPEAPPTPPVVKPINLNYNAGAETISLNLKNDSIQKVVQAIISETGRNIIISPNIKPDKKLSVFLQNVKLESAIEKMAFANGLEMEKTEDGFFVLTTTDAPQNQQQGNSGNNRYRNQKNKQNKSKGKNLDLTITDSSGVKFISFEALDTPIAEAIKYVSEEIGANYFLFSDPSGNTTAQLSKVSYDEFLTYILHGTKHTYKKDKDLYLIGERSLEGLRKTKVIKLQYRSLEDVLNIIPNDVKDGVQITEFKELNSFILSGSAPQIAEIESFVYDIDKIVPLIMIEVIMVDINKAHTITTGISTGINTGEDLPVPGGTILSGTQDAISYTLSPQTINSMTSPLNLGKVDKNFYLSLKAMETNDNAQIRSMPKLATLNSHEATLSIGTKRNYIIENSNIVGSLTPTTTVTRQVQSAEANLEISITPLVSGDDHVTLNINISNSGFITEPKDNRPPDTRNSSFTSLIRVRDNDMVLLGGMETINKTETGTGIPFLARIPVIKWFFSSRSKTKNKSVSVVFIKPSIIY